MKIIYEENSFKPPSSVLVSMSLPPPDTVAHVADVGLVRKVRVRPEGDYTLLIKDLKDL